MNQTYTNKHSFFVNTDMSQADFELDVQNSDILALLDHLFTSDPITNYNTI